MPPAQAIPFTVMVDQYRRHRYMDDVMKLNLDGIKQLDRFVDSRHALEEKHKHEGEQAKHHQGRGDASGMKGPHMCVGASPCILRALASAVIWGRSLKGQGKVGTLAC